MSLFLSCESVVINTMANIASLPFTIKEAQIMDLHTVSEDSRMCQRAQHGLR